MIISKGTTVYDNENNEYLVEERIGGGGFSAVFRIKNKQNGTYYALKTFSSDFENETELRTFKNEISKAIEVQSPNVVEYIFFNDGEIFTQLPPYIILEYCNNGTLKDFLENLSLLGKELSNKEIKEIFLQLIDGMNCINQKVIHRDIKLENILLKDNVLKISDFGISKSVFQKTRTITFKGFGSPQYIAPEGWKMDTNTIQMDIYSMGIVFYQIATLLKYPYAIEKETIEEYKDAHLYATVTNPRVYNSKLDLAVESIILRMLEKEPGKRFKNWEEIKEKITINAEDKGNILLDKALKKRIALDEEKRKQEIKIIQKNEEINENKKIISFSIKENIYIPIYNFIEAFNQKYSSGNIHISNFEISLNSINQIQIKTVSNKSLKIVINTIIDEVFEYECKDPFFEKYYKKQYRPQLNGKEILAWGAVFFEKLCSYNLVLVKDDENVYGKWYQIKNRNSAFNTNPRPIEPFAFDFHEIEKEIKMMNAVHIYTSKIEEFNAEEILENMENII